MISKRWLKLLSVAVFSIVAFAAGAVFWADLPCSQPSCARSRYSLFVELDSFRDIPPIPMELNIGGRSVSARTILASGGIDVEIESDDRSLPYDAESGPLDRADLYQYSLAWRNLAAPAEVDGQIYAMITPALISDRGEPLFGLMFDGAGREGIAVAPRQTVQTFERTSAASIPTLQLRTFMHEMLHALNRHHLDAMQMRDGRISLEAPTRCLAKQENGEWVLVEEPFLALSPGTIRFFQTAAARDIMPGSANSPFEGLHSSASECEDARANTYDTLANSRWEFAKQRFFEFLGVGSARAQEPVDLTEEPPSVEPEVASISLQVQAQSAPYPTGYPIGIRIIAENRSDQMLPIKGRLAPSYGLVQVEVRQKGTEDWQAFKPLVWYEPANDAVAALEPGERTEQTAPIYFGDGGWTFAEPGDYEVRATLKPSEGSTATFSNVILVRTEEPQTDEERLVLRSLLDTEGSLDADIGRLLVFGGRIGDAESRAPIENAVAQHPNTALGSALKLTLASQRLSPSINPITGERPAPSFADAATLLEDACTDSGIAALKSELLARFAAELPTELSQELRSSAEAWDGSTARGYTIPTYSDPGLQPFDSSIHFCVNQASIHMDLRAEAARVARRVKQLGARRIVVVGHADFAGRCGLNDSLALSRAQTVSKLLRGAGVRKVETVSLGEHRPISFSTSEEARLQNRRVDILIEAEGATEEDSTTEVERLVPRCPP